jgi:predicted DNA binding CopG/RHH family protein
LANLFAQLGEGDLEQSLSDEDFRQIQKKIQKCLKKKSEKIDIQIEEVDVNNHH